MISKFNIILLIIFITRCICFSQINGYELDPKKLEIEGDKLGETAIILNLKLDTLRIEIDSLKNYRLLLDNDILKSNKELLELIGHTPESLNEFRRKFDETEKRIKNKDGSPMDAKKYYYDEITIDKARCIPEFADRYETMKKLMLPWCCSDEIKTTTANINNTYKVKRGDCLKKIAKKIWGREIFWEKIFEANKNGVFNQEDLPYFQKKVNEPDLIFPGQVLIIPSN